MCGPRTANGNTYLVVYIWIEIVALAVHATAMFRHLTCDAPFLGHRFVNLLRRFIVDNHIECGHAKVHIIHTIITFDPFRPIIRFVTILGRLAAGILFINVHIDTVCKISCRIIEKCVFVLRVHACACTCDKLSVNWSRKQIDQNVDTLHLIAAQFYCTHIHAHTHTSHGIRVQIQTQIDLLKALVGKQWIRRAGRINKVFIGARLLFGNHIGWCILAIIL